MHALTQIFPPGNFTPLGFILLLPLLGAFGSGVFGKRLGKEAVTLMALSAVGLAFVASLVSFCVLACGGAEHGAEAHHHAAPLLWKAWSWMDIVGSGPALGAQRAISIDVAFRFDQLSGVMCLVITGIGFLIHLYSTKYMSEDPGYYRFFAYLNLFVFSMLVLVLGDSLPILFVGWEGVGLCSYLLIGFWFSEDANASAGKKAFITNRVGDFGLLVAMGLLAYHVGALDWAGIASNKHALLTPVRLWPVTDTVPIAALLPESIGQAISAPLYLDAATLVCLALFVGAMGKSAQFGLHIWLPDAMAGPTPVSALIHAATMVTAGVYLLCRLSGVFVLSPAAMMIIAGFGAFTALFAATIALVQNDIKKVLAYSTLSQLGYMFLGAGVGAFEAGFFHVLTHAFFKACLFLGAGSVIHAMHARIHSTEDSQDMRNMGGMMKFMPGTAITFIAAWAAIVGLPLTSGFVSKDEILLMATSSTVVPRSDEIRGIARGAEVAIDAVHWPVWYSWALYAMGLATAILTAFYMSRLVIGIFWGEFRGWKIVEGWVDPHAHGHGHDDHTADAHAAHAVAHGDHGHDDHADDHAHDDHAHPHEQPGVDHMDGPTPHESPWQITAPLWILGGLSVFAGFLNFHLFHIAPLGHFLEPIFEASREHVVVSETAETFLWPGIAIAILIAFCGGVGAAWWMYIKEGGKPAAELAIKYPGLRSFLADKWRVDEFYQRTILAWVDALAEMCTWFDKYVVDMLLARVTAGITALVGTLLRQLQTGRVQSYAAMTAVGLACIGFYLIRPQASVREQIDPIAGTYVLSASPGFGYSYRWDVDGDDKGSWDGDFGGQTQARFAIGSAGEERTVRLQVKNAFGQVAEKEFTYVRERYDASAPGAVEGGARIIQGRDGKLRSGSPPGAMPGRPGAGQKPNAEAIQRALREQGQHP